MEEFRMVATLFFLASGFVTIDLKLELQPPPATPSLPPLSLFLFPSISIMFPVLF